MTAEQIADVVGMQYLFCEKGTGSTFVRLAVLLDDLMRVGGDHAYTICAKAFPTEFEAWQRGFDDSAPHPRFAIRFPDLN
jgi:hypothetical protein